MKRLLAMLAMGLVSASAHAISISCHMTFQSAGYRALNPWPFDTVELRATWWPVCGNFACVGEAAFVGATAEVNAGSVVVLDLYGSDGTPMPPGVQAQSTRIAGSTATASVGPLAPGDYTFVVRTHQVDASGVRDPCGMEGLSTLAIPSDPGVQRQVAIEFHRAANDHYFVTADLREIADLDSGAHAGWARTGSAFEVFVPGRSAGTGVPVCRFIGLDSHFYTSDSAECAELPGKFNGAWQLETADAFEVANPGEAGACLPGFTHVYRLWNRRADSNHRFTTNTQVARAMQAQGWLLEGAPMCAPGVSDLY